MQHPNIASKKICHLTSVHYLFDTRIYYKECRTLSSNGFDVHLIACTESPDDVSIAKKQAIRLVPIPKPRNRWERITRTIWRVYKAAQEIDAAIYHFHDPELIPVGIMLAMKGYKVIYDIHEDVPRALLSPGHYYLPKWSKKVIAWFLEQLEDFAAPRFAACITATPHIENRFRKLQPATYTVNNYPILDEFSSNDMSKPWRNRENAIAYVGGLSITRGLKKMVQAIGYFSDDFDLRLKLMGNYTPPEFRNDIQKLSGWQRVDELGYLGRKEIGEVLANVKAGLVLIRPEPRYLVSQPVKLYEYMSASIPIIASDFPFWRELIERERCGLVVDPLDPHAIAAAIEYLITHDDEAEAMGYRGRQAIEQRYNWSREADSLLAVYSSLLVLQRNVALICSKSGSEACKTP